MNKEIERRDNDPVVDEVRKAREAYAAKFGFDLRAIFEDIQKRQASSGATYVQAPVPSESSKKAG